MRVSYLGAFKSSSFDMETGTRILNPESPSLDQPISMENYTSNRRIDINEFCIDNSAATFCVRVQGESMSEAGIFANDVLIVDRSLNARHGDIVIACVDGGMTVKTLEIEPELLLRPQNVAFKAIPITEGMDFEIFGVVKAVVRKLR